MIRAFHGSKKSFDRFDMSLAGTSGKLDYGYGIYFTESPAIAQKHGRVYAANLRVEYLLDLDVPMRWQSHEVRRPVIQTLQRCCEALRDAGLHGITYLDYSTGKPVRNYVVFRPDLIDIVK